MRLTSFLLVISLSSFGQDRSEFIKKAFANEKGNQLNYRILPPLNLADGKEYPLVIFLHGSGERGDDNEAQLTHGADLFLEASNRSDFPAFVVFPQCPEDQGWANLKKWQGPNVKQLKRLSEPLSLMFEMLDHLKDSLPIDTSKIYLSGLSLGGYGTYEAAYRRPNEFAAILPICGGADTSIAEDIKDIPMWIFHGADDDVVGVELSRVMVKALEDAGAKPRYTEYEGVKHDSWNNAFAEPEFLSWMFLQVNNHLK